MTTETVSGTPDPPEAIAESVPACRTTTSRNSASPATACTCSSDTIAPEASRKLTVTVPLNPVSTAPEASSAATRKVGIVSPTTVEGRVSVTAPPRVNCVRVTPASTSNALELPGVSDPEEAVS